MYKKLRKLLVAAGLLAVPALMQHASASHFQGSELTYACMAPNIYVVQVVMYRDCTGATAPTSITLDLKPQGCAGGRTITVQRTGTPTMGNPYCPQIPQTCSTVRANYEEVRFSTTITFTAAEQACAGGMKISSTNNARPEIFNLVNPQGDLYSESYVNLAAGINNNSPIFGTLVVPFVNPFKPIMLSMHAYDSDGDSLVYSLKSPLLNATTPYTYKSYQAEMLYNSDSTKYALAPAGNFSDTYPIHSYYVDWTQPMPIVPTQAFSFDTNTGSMFFIPTRYKNTPPVNGDNKYAVVVQVDEYRKINGVITKIGHVRRDMFITLFDCGPNVNPNITAPVANGQPIAATDMIRLRPGTPLTFQFASADNNTADVLDITTDASTVLPGAYFTKSSGNNPTGTITWTPTAAHVRSLPYYIHINVMDNACPIKGYQTHTYAIRVSATGGVTSISEEVVGNTAFVAYPNPFRNEVSFKLNQVKAAQTIVIYNALGQKVDQISLSGLPVENKSVKWNNASKFAAGSYVARLISADKTVQTVKFSKLQ